MRLILEYLKTEEIICKLTSICSLLQAVDLLPRACAGADGGQPAALPAHHLLPRQVASRHISMLCGAISCSPPGALHRPFMSGSLAGSCYSEFSCILFVCICYNCTIGPGRTRGVAWSRRVRGGWSPGRPGSSWWASSSPSSPLSTLSSPSFKEAPYPLQGPHQPGAVHQAVPGVGPPVGVLHGPLHPPRPPPQGPLPLPQQPRGLLQDR